eukprot:9169200-Pyramimonas_sp.AAC.1
MYTSLSDLKAVHWVLMARWRSPAWAFRNADVEDLPCRQRWWRTLPNLGRTASLSHGATT